MSYKTFWFKKRLSWDDGKSSWMHKKGHKWWYLEYNIPAALQIRRYKNQYKKREKTMKVEECTWINILSGDW